MFLLVLVCVSACSLAADGAPPPHQVSSFGLLFRAGTVFYTAIRLFLDYKICQWRCNQLSDDAEERVNEIWERTHSRNAKFLCTKFVRLEGLWLKLGQYLSSRADGDA